MGVIGDNETEETGRVSAPGLAHRKLSEHEV